MPIEPGSKSVVPQGPIDLSALKTVTKSGVVEAINEVLDDVIEVPSESLTSNHSVTTELSLAVRRHLITSDGSGLAQTVDLPSFPLNGDGYNGDHLGERHYILLVNQVNDSDTLNITINGGGDNIYVADPFGNFINAGTELVLNYTDADAELFWAGYAWQWDNTADNTGTQLHSLSIPDPTNAFQNDRSEALVVSKNADGSEFTVGWSQDIPTPGTTWNMDSHAAGATYYIGSWWNPITTSGSGGLESISLNGQDIDSSRQIGLRALFQLVAKGNAGDSVQLVGDNMTLKKSDGSSLTSLTLNNVGDYVVLEVWDCAINGVPTVRIVRTTATVV